MLSFFIGLLTVLMVLDCVLLVLLVLVQLPKKEAGAGLAFGGAATDALFGAGSGNVLTSVTKYVAGAFFVLAILLAVLGTPRKTNNSLVQELTKTTGSAPISTTTAAPSAAVPAPAAKPSAENPAPVTAPATVPSTNK